MTLRTRLTDALKLSMKAADAPRTSTLRMVLAKIKDIDIAARPSGTPQVNDDAITAALRTMIKSRRDSINLYVQGNRPELAAKEEAEVAIIAAFLPQQMDEAATEAAIDAAIATTGAATVKDMGKLMAALKSTHGAALDMALVNRLAKARLAA